MPQVQVIQPIQQQPKRLRVAAYARVSSKSANQLNSMSVQVEYYTDLIQKNPDWEFAGVYADATDIIGLKQNPTNGRRFSPIFLCIGHFSE